MVLCVFTICTRARRAVARLGVLPKAPSLLQHQEGAVQVETKAIDTAAYLPPANPATGVHIAPRPDRRAT